MYDKDEVIKKLNQAKKDLIIKMVTNLNEAVIEHNVNIQGIGFSGYKDMCRNYFNNELDSLVDSVISNDYDLSSISNMFAVYYKKFCDIFKCYLSKDIITEGIINIDKEIINLNLINIIISVSYEEWINQNQFFADFQKMTRTFERVKLTNYEQFSIVMETIYRNLHTDLLKCESQNSVNFFSHASGQINGFTSEEMIEIVSDDKYNYLLDKHDSELSALELRQKNVLVSSKEIAEEKKDFDLEKLKVIYKNIKEHYFDKLDENGKPENLNNNDVNTIIDMLKKLNVTDRFSSIAKRILTKYIVKDEPKYNFVNSTKFSKKLINDKEYKAIRNEIKEYFDMHSGKVVRPLSEEEVLCCANLMLKIGEDKLVRTLFDRTKQHEKNPISRYVREYDKLKYYENRLDIGQEIKDMEFAFQNMILSSDEDYNILKSMLDEDLRKVESLLPSGYEYEMNKAKEYKKSSIC